ncbi:expressed protein [Dictyostelium purpureum]|uniref:Expressed protein n=1 Tax=Dictyostelium purpureum TaxID=5786 RepID=F0ZUA0_DICPU|nr:uncharacterized protein DICPUDRAFT_155542 [Dictyostelium purpureum]EGC32491.1 expressed protein [Dictyostelium purpureum]|eukprot:XP_003290984.1 expressed protein [Dictyostelium purpureum]
MDASTQNESSLNNQESLNNLHTIFLLDFLESKARQNIQTNHINDGSNPQLVEVTDPKLQSTETRSQQELIQL